MINFLIKPYIAFIQLGIIVVVAFVTIKFKTSEKKLKRTRVFVGFLMYPLPFLLFLGVLFSLISGFYVEGPWYRVDDEMFRLGFATILMLCTAQIVFAVNRLLQMNYDYVNSKRPLLRTDPHSLRRLIIAMGAVLVIGFFLPLNDTENGFTWKMLKLADVGSPMMFTYLHLLVGGGLLLAMGFATRIPVYVQLIVAGIVSTLPLIWDSMENILVGVQVTTAQFRSPWEVSSPRHCLLPIWKFVATEVEGISPTWTARSCSFCGLRSHGSVCPGGYHRQGCFPSVHNR